MMTWTHEDLDPELNRKPIPPENTIVREDELANVVGVALKAAALVLLVLISYDAGGAREAQLTLDAYAREHDAEVRMALILTRYGDGAETALEVCRAVDAELHRLPSFEAPPIHRADF